MDLRQGNDGAAEALIDEAAAWFARMQNPDVSIETRRQFEAWLSRSDAHERAYGRVRRVWTDAPFLLTPSAGQAPAHRTVANFRTAAKLAAALIVLGAAGLGLHHLRRPPAPGGPRPAIAGEAAEEASYATTPGTRSSLALPDGSVVILDRGSAVQMRYSGNERAILLAKGQAMFEVAKHQARPFHVYAGDRQVTATGTAFNVRLEEKNVEVTLMEGSVLVGEIHPAALAPRPPAKLEPGERLVAPFGGAPQISTSSFDDIVNWHTDRVIALNSPLGSVIQILNRFDGPQITAKDDRIAGLKIDGTLRTDDPAAAARAIAQIYHLRLVQTAPRRILLTQE